VLFRSNIMAMRARLAKFALAENTEDPAEPARSRIRSRSTAGARSGSSLQIRRFGQNSSAQQFAPKLQKQMSAPDAVLTRNYLNIWAKPFS